MPDTNGSGSSLDNVVLMPRIVDGIWMNWRDKDIEYSVEKPFENHAKKTAFGMQVIARFKVENITDVKEIKIDTFENDLLSADPVETGLSAKCVKEDKTKQICIYEAEVSIDKANYFETTGRESISEFYFVPNLDKVEEKIKLPLDPNQYLRVNSPESLNAQVLEIANLYSGGGYLNNGVFKTERWGMAETIRFKNDDKPPKEYIFDMKTVKTTFCSGFTFWVAMRVLQSNRMIDKKTPDDIKKFQRFFNGSAGTSGDLKKMCAYAIPQLGVGSEINFSDCIPGDFVQIGRFNKQGKYSPDYGHSVIFLEWVMENDIIVGFKYRSTQPKTDGIGDNIEYFYIQGQKQQRGRVSQENTFAARIEN